jgi:PAS domain-containing protein
MTEENIRGEEGSGRLPGQYHRVRMPVVSTKKNRDFQGTEGFSGDRSSQLAEALRRAEQSYRNQFVYNSAVMLLVDPSDGAVIDANMAAVGFYGYTREQFVKMRITDISFLTSDEFWPAMAPVLSEQGR